MKSVRIEFSTIILLNLWTGVEKGQTKNGKMSAVWNLIFYSKKKTSKNWKIHCDL